MPRLSVFVSLCSKCVYIQNQNFRTVPDKPYYMCMRTIWGQGGSHANPRVRYAIGPLEIQSVIEL